MMVIITQTEFTQRELNYDLGILWCRAEAIKQSTILRSAFYSHSFIEANV